jgi:DNA-binding MarR family transcriptional regulator
MGITRQGALKQLDLLEEEGLIEKMENENNERSPLYDLTPQGRQKYASAMKLQEKWISDLIRNLRQADLRSTAAILNRLIIELEVSQQKGVLRKDESLS